MMQVLDLSMSPYELEEKKPTDEEDGSRWRSLSFMAEKLQGQYQNLFFSDLKTSLLQILSTNLMNLFNNLQK